MSGNRSAVAAFVVVVGVVGAVAYVNRDRLNRVKLKKKIPKVKHDQKEQKKSDLTKWKQILEEECPRTTSTASPLDTSTPSSLDSLVHSTRRASSPSTDRLLSSHRPSSPDSLLSSRSSLSTTPQSSSLLSLLPEHTIERPAKWLSTISIAASTQSSSAETLFLRYLSLSHLFYLSTVCKLWYQTITTIVSETKYIEESIKFGYHNSLQGGYWKTVSKSLWLSGLSTTHEKNDHKYHPQSKSNRLKFKENQYPSYSSIKLTNEHVKSEIEKDSCRTIIHHDAFNDIKEADRILGNILEAYAQVDSEVGYCQGMNFIAAQYLITMNEMDSFWSFYTLMQHPRLGFRSFFVPGLPGLLLCKFQFSCLLQHYLPEIAKNFDSLGLLEDDNYNTPWFMTLYTKLELPQETLRRIWDLLLIYGLPVLHQTGLAILVCVQEKLQGLPYEDLFMYLRTLPDKELLTPSRVLSEFVPISNRALLRLQDLWVQSRQ